MKHTGKQWLQVRVNTPEERASRCLFTALPFVKTIAFLWGRSSRDQFHRTSGYAELALWIGINWEMSSWNKPAWFRKSRGWYQTIVWDMMRREKGGNCGVQILTDRSMTQSCSQVSTFSQWDWGGGGTKSWFVCVGNEEKNSPVIGVGVSNTVEDGCVGNNFLHVFSIKTRHKLWTRAYGILKVRMQYMQ